MSLAPRLVEFATAPLAQAETARQVARLSALDWVAVGRAGRDEPVARLVREMILTENGASEAHVFGSEQRVPARGAALVNGTVSHALDYDDTHFAHIGHPSVAVFSAALAVGEARGATLSDAIDAALVGMEVSIRVGLWLGRAHYQVGFHQTATAGAFGASVAAGRLLKLNTDQMAQALGLTTTRASGLKAQFGTMGKPYNAGMAAANGVECAALAEAGFVANPDSFEGAYGFGATHFAENAADDALSGLGQRWLFEEVSHKFHACCHGLHAALEAARELDIAEPEIAALTVHTHPRWMSVCNQLTPTTGLGAKFSYRTVLAMRALGHDTAALDSYSEAVCALPKLVALRERIQVREDETLSETAARLSVIKRDGTTQEATHDLLTPMSLDQRQARVQAKADTLIGAEAAREIWALLARGGTASELGALVGNTPEMSRPDFV